MAHTVRYTVTRREVWRWYWRAWARPAGLWMFHVLIALAVAATRTMPGSAAFDPGLFLRIAAVVGLVCVVLMPLWPQLRFKPQERTLTIDESGWTTQIGELSGNRTWSELRAIEDLGAAVVLTGKNRNALIVPARAFADANAQQQFVADAVNWHRVASPAAPY